MPEIRKTKIKIQPFPETTTARVHFTKKGKENWWLSRHERVVINIFIRNLQKKKRVTITTLQELPELKCLKGMQDIMKRSLWTRYMVIMLKALGYVRIRCNNGKKIITWKE
tara:strand:+ start:26 stop:358 length:333 start_codon:yes stop_codon:yes gene_type:complete